MKVTNFAAKMKTRGRQSWIPPEEIEGLDKPLIFPVPDGYVQDWDYTHKRYKLRKIASHHLCTEKDIDEEEEI